MNCTCPHCKAQYDLKDDLLGKNLECPNCKNTFIAKPFEGEEVPPTLSSTPEKSLTGKGTFGKNKYGIKQKKIAINEKYYVKDENNNDLFFSVRRIHFWRRFGAILLGIIAVLVSIIVGINLSMLMSSDIFMIGIILIFFAIGAISLVMIISIASRRNIEFYLSEEDMNKSNVEFAITQDNIYEFVHKKFTLKHDNVQIAQFEKNIFTDIIRKKWHMYYNGKHILVKEESVILGILRRLGIPFIRTNFVFIDISENPKSDIIIGYFKRKFEIFDNYLLDMSNDPSFIVPREIAICMAILLDCGERR